MKKPKTQTQSSHDPNLAARVGDSFRQHAQTFTKGLNKDMNIASNEAVKDLGGLISSATMLALAIELYLKSLRVFCKADVPKTHKLLLLYKDLPQKLKESIETIYHERSNTLTDTNSIILHMRRKNERFQDTNEDVQNDFISVLARSNDAFVNWRYIHEGPSSDEPLLYSYDFCQLNLIADILKDHILFFDSLKNKNINFDDIPIIKGN